MRLGSRAPRPRISYDLLPVAKRSAGDKALVTSPLRLDNGGKSLECLYRKRWVAFASTDRTKMSPGI